MLNYRSITFFVCTSVTGEMKIQLNISDNGYLYFTEDGVKYVFLKINNLPQPDSRSFIGKGHSYDGRLFVALSME